MEEAKLLLDAKASVDVTTFRGFSALSAAAAYGHEEIARLLIDSGANVNVADLDGGTPLHWARVRGYKSIEDLLRQRAGMELPAATREWPYP